MEPTQFSKLGAANISEPLAPFRLRHFLATAMIGLGFSLTIAWISLLIYEVVSLVY